jgi:hypothetical protein
MGTVVADADLVERHPRMSGQRGSASIDAPSWAARMVDNGTTRKAISTTTASTHVSTTFG